MALIDRNPIQEEHEYYAPGIAMAIAYIVGLLGILISLPAILFWFLLGAEMIKG